MIPECAGGCAAAPHADLSSQSVSLKRAAEACGNGDVDFYLQKARMASIKAHASECFR